MPNLIRDMMKFDVKAINFCMKLSRYKNAIKYRSSDIYKEMRSLPHEGVGKDLFIILNGPSLKNQDLTLLKGKNLMFVNRGFMHPLYKELQPKYHVFVDDKLVNGVWDIKWVDQIFEMCPNIKMIFPILWYFHPTFEKYKDDKRIFWQSWTLPFYINGVSNNCFSFAIEQEFSNIFFTGFDGNGFAYDMVKASGQSHFYGADPELLDMTSKQHVQAMFTTFLQIEDLRGTSCYCRKHGINIFNLTEGGICDMFIRRDFKDPYNKETEIPIKPELMYSYL